MRRRRRNPSLVTYLEHAASKLENARYMIGRATNSNVRTVVANAEALIESALNDLRYVDRLIERAEQQGNDYGD